MKHLTSATTEHLAITEMTTTVETVLSAHNLSRFDDEGAVAALAQGLVRELQPLIVIETTYDTKGSRIKAQMKGTSYACTIGLDHSLSTDAAHLKAALWMLGQWFEGEELVPVGSTDTAKGWAFVFVHR